MKKYKKIAILIILIFVVFSLTGCSDSQDGDLKTKVISELDFINVKTIDMLNKLNSISFESYAIISEQVKFTDEEKQNNQSQSGKSTETSSGTEEGGSSSGGGSSDTNGQEGQQSEQGTSNDKINTTNMVMDVELDKDRNNIDWTTIKNEVELLDESWAVITLDLYTLNVKSDTILGFSDKLNTVMVAIKNEDKQKSLTALADLYSSIPEFLREVEADKNMQKIRQTQSYVIDAYILADDIGNTEISKNLTQAITTYSEVMSDIDYTKDKTEKTNKVYVLLNELSNSLKEKDTDVFYIKYKNFMKEIEAI
ncbi:MAG: hypothetical protein J6A29_03550 [Clostridia bacterium]|nr:hypothetical protein [Clostridia bacterium]